MDIKPITTSADCRAALEEIDSVTAAEKGTPEGERLNALANLVVTYEATVTQFDMMAHGHQTDQNTLRPPR